MKRFARFFFWENKYMCICTSTKHVEHYNRLPFFKRAIFFRTLPLAMKRKNMDHQSLTRRVKHERDNIMLPIIWKKKINQILMFKKKNNNKKMMMIKNRKK